MIRTAVTFVLLFATALTANGFSIAKPSRAVHHHSLGGLSSEQPKDRRRSEVILDCFACGRYASYAMFDGGVVAQEPIAQEKFRTDYELSPYRINRIHLDITIEGKGDDVTLVKSTMNVSPQAQSGESVFELGNSNNSDNKNQQPVPLELDGEDLELRLISLNGKDLVEGEDYILAPEGGLTVLNPPRELALSDSPSKSFVLETVVAIKPQENTQLSGLYKSNGMFVTQCEAQGFRRITYFQDRPDIMATYDVQIEADKELYPVLLSNGNAVEQGDVEGNSERHWAKFSDPFPKPSYLFAVVAGDLGKIAGTFQTMSGRDVGLLVWSEPENVDQLDWALKSLKDAMFFDERTYGREYDLDVYNIVAVNDFNMGAMENKGLNIFNTNAVLAKPSTATDQDYERVQGVVGHEYFHNWSGNRVTCRDWFQLTLKEGLTVFRDQHFSEDMTSEAVKRIEDVRVVRSAQFVQDAGPMAHPIRPESYVAMDNFYTVTVYNKGAEVIRMYRTLLGRETFRTAMDLYFERHDGQAVTCDDFRRAMADASGRDLTQFENWYLQAGTPIVTAASSYDANTQTYRLTLSQRTAATPNQDTKEPFHIPVAVGLLGKDGTILVETTLELTEERQTFEFSDLPEEPYVPSLFRGFSAPIKLESDITPDQLAFLAANDNDPFNRWDASQQLYTREILRLVKAYQTNQEMVLDDSVSAAFRSTLTDEGLDPSLRAYSLAMPTYSTLAQEVVPIDVDAILEATRFVRKRLAETNKEELLTIYNSLDSKGAPYEITEKQVGERRLRNTCLAILSTLKDEHTIQLCVDQFETAESMTDSLAALQCLADVPGPEREETFKIFYERAKTNNESLVVTKWLQTQAGADIPNAVEEVKALLNHEGYESTNPNAIRALLQMFASGNPSGFHKSDGSGYEFIASQVIEIDQTNPQVAARLASSFDTWQKQKDDRKALMKAQLERIQNEAQSSDTLEIVNRSLG